MYARCRGGCVVGMVLRGWVDDYLSGFEGGLEMFMIINDYVSF